MLPFSVLPNLPPSALVMSGHVVTIFFNIFKYPSYRFCTVLDKFGILCIGIHSVVHRNEGDSVFSDCFCVVNKVLACFVTVLESSAVKIHEDRERVTFVRKMNIKLLERVPELAVLNVEK